MLWQFDNTCDFLGAASGPEAARLLDKLGEPQGSTALGQAIHKMIEHGARDILVLTDGQTWAHDVPNMIGSGCRISAALVGEGSLDANIGHIVAATGGQIFYAPTDDVETALVSAFDAGRGGIGFSLEWSPAGSAGVDTVGRIAAALALPSLPEGLAMDWAFRHGLCSHLASLVVVDDAGEATRLIPETRKVPLSAPSMFDAPMRRMRVAQVADNSAPPRRSVLSDFGDAALRMPKAVFHRPLGEDMRRLAEEIDLETQANTFLSGNFAALSSEDRRLLGRICRCVAVIDLAAELGVPTESLGLALIAEQLPTRSPKVDRFIRRVLGREDPWRLQDLLRKLAIW